VVFNLSVGFFNLNTKWFSIECGVFQLEHNFTKQKKLSQTQIFKCDRGPAQLALTLFPNLQEKPHHVRVGDCWVDDARRSNANVELKPAKKFAA